MAILDEDYAALHVALVASGQHADAPGWKGIGLDAVEPPERRPALDAIAACENVGVLVHQQWMLAQGAAITPASRLTAARAAIALGQGARAVAPAETLRA